MVKFVKANLSDIADMPKIVGDSVEDGTILRRTHDEVATNIRSYTSGLRVVMRL